MSEENKRNRRIPINWEKIERNFLYDDFEMGVSYYFYWTNLKEAIDDMDDIDEKILTLLFIKKIILQYMDTTKHKDLLNKINAEFTFLEKENSLSSVFLQSLNSKVDSSFKKKEKSKTNNKKRVPVPQKIKAILQREINSNCPFCNSIDP